MLKLGMAVKQYGGLAMGVGLYFGAANLYDGSLQKAAAMGMAFVAGLQVASWAWAKLQAKDENQG